MDEKRHPKEPNKAHKEPKPVWTGQVIERKKRERNKRGHCPRQRATSRRVRCALATMIAGLSPKKARIDRVSRRPPKGARRGIGKMVLPCGDDRWGWGCATTHATPALLTQGKEKATTHMLPLGSAQVALKASVQSLRCSSFASFFFSFMCRSMCV